MSDDSLAIALALVLRHTDQLTTIIIDNCKKTAPMTKAQADRVYRALIATALIVQTEIKAIQEIIDHDN